MTKVQNIKESAGQSYGNYFLNALRSNYIK